MLRVAVVCAAAAGVAGQNAGTLQQERHPSLTIQQCTKAGGCTTEQRSVVIDANWRWSHATSGSQNCYTGNTWDQGLCPDPETCTKNCAIEGADQEYTSTYGVNANGAEMKLKFVTQGPYSTNVGSRSYLLEDESKYKLFHLKNREFTFDVDVANLPCGLNGALYFVQMDADGGMSRYPNNKAGAKLGTGYCDAQCPHDVKWINGEANMKGWWPFPNDKNSGLGHYGSCCTEMDIWESNSISTAFTPHACSVNKQTRCEGKMCGDSRLGPDPNHRFDGACDKNGCDFQTYRLGDKGFWGPGANFTIDTRQPVTVVTQFITADGTDSGALVEIRRHYKQGGRFIQTPTIRVGSGSFNSVTKEYCEAEVGLYKDNTNFLAKGGLGAVDKAFEKGMVLALSMWDDHDVNMLWLDSTYPTTGGPGAARGTCSTSSGVPADVESQHGDAYVRYFNIRYGEIGATVPGDAPAPGPAPGPTPPAPGPSPSGCPGGSLTACIDLCPSNPAKAYKVCVNSCVKRC